MCSPHHRPTLGPWSLRSAAPVPPPLLQLRPRPQKQLPAPITTQATHTMSTCPRASLHLHPTTPQKTRRPSRPCPPPSLSPNDPSLGLPWGGDPGRPGRALSSPGLMINSYQDLALMEGRGSWPLRGASQLPELAQPQPLPTFPLTSMGLSGAWDDPLFFTVGAPSHRATLWPLPHRSPAPSG